MGVEPQTVENGLKPYGLLFVLLYQYRVPIQWSVKEGKDKDEVDFTYNGRDFKGGPFIIDAAFRTPAVDSVLMAWETKGVVGLTTTSEVTVPLAFTIKYSLAWTLDRQNGPIVAKYSPVAINDLASTTPGIAINLNALDNDYDANLDPLTFTPLSPLNTPNGTFINNGNGVITYISTPSYVGLDTLHYEICDTTLAIDGGPFCDTAMVIIENNYFDVNGCFPSQTFRTLALNIQK